MDQQFKNQVVLVTGAGSGIGQASAMAFAKAGARVAVADIDAAAGAETVANIMKADGQATFFQVDVTVASEVEQLVRQIVQTWGRLDIAHNNAGITCPNALTAATQEADFDRVVAINLKGVWLCMKYAIDQMLTQGSGVIVNSASALSLTVLPGSAPYNASKHAVAGLTKTAAVEYASKNIRINAVCPGVITTPMLSNARPDPASVEALVGLHPAGRLGTVEEIANAVLWLASPGASFVHGSLVSVDGGWAAS